MTIDPKTIAEMEKRALAKTDPLSPVKNQGDTVILTEEEVDAYTANVDLSGSPID